MVVKDVVIFGFNIFFYKIIFLLVIFVENNYVVFFLIFKKELYIGVLWVDFVEIILINDNFYLW